MEKRKNLCAMIPESLYQKVQEEKADSTLSQYMESILKEHFERSAGTMENGKRTVAVQISEELFQKLKEHLKREGMSQKEFLIRLIEDAIREAEIQTEEAQVEETQPEEEECEKTESEEEQIEGDLKE